MMKLYKIKVTPIILVQDDFNRVAIKKVIAENSKAAENEVRKSMGSGEVNIGGILGNNLDWAKAKYEIIEEEIIKD